MSYPARPLAALAGLALTLVASLAPAPRAEENAFLYTLTEGGQMGLQVTPLERLTRSPFRFVDLVVVDAQRWALGVDGRVFRDGALFEQLPFPSGSPLTLTDDRLAWIRLLLEDIDGDGDDESPDRERLALSAGGLVTIDGELVATLPNVDIVQDDFDTDEFFLSDPVLFVDIVVTPAGVFALRLDGALFDIFTGLRVGDLEGGPSVTGEPEGGDDTLWVRVVYDEDSGDLLALRADGVLVALDPFELPFGPDEFGEVPLLGLDLGEIVTILPRSDFTLNDRADLYVDLIVDAGGTWYVLRRDGAVHTEDSLAVTFLPPVGAPNFIGNPYTTPLQGPNRLGNPFMEIVELEGILWRVRSLGQLYHDANLVDNLLQIDFVALAADSATPNLDGVLNKPPTITNYKARFVEGEDIVVPIIPLDVDQPLDEVEVEVDLTKFPGAVYDAKTGTVTREAGLEPGRYRFVVRLDDGGPQKRVRQRFNVRVLEPNTREDKNTRPVTTRMSGTAALVGRELILPIFATSRDGKAVKIVPDGGDVFERGAEFDQTTNLLTWTPDCIDAGRRTARFRVNDGTRSRRLKVRIAVLFPLFFPPVAGPVDPDEPED